jgi:dTDP-4-amino-4,6-dideoxygalactose transaminase
MSDIKKTVPLLDLKAQYKTIKEEVKAAIDRVLESQYFILGPEVEALEKEIAEYCGCRHAVGVSSGTDALLVALMALGIGPGDEVVTSPFTFFATVGAVLRLGARPVLADMVPDTFNIDPVKLEQAISPRTKAVIPVHLFGQSADMDPLLELAAKRNIHVIEDAAQAIGTDYKGRRAGSMGAVGCFSFFPSKNLGAYGEGGIITTNDDNLADQMKVIRNQGAHPKYNHGVLGGNFRLDAIQAAVLRVKLNYLESWTEKRRSNAAFYTKGINELNLVSKFVQPPAIVFERHVFNQYVIRCKNRDGLREFLGQNGVSTEIYYPKPMHFQGCFNNHAYRPGDFPVSEQACEAVLALPIYPELGLDQKSYILETIAKFYASGR